MRRTPRTEFADARSAAAESRQAMLERVGLRPESGHKPKPTGFHLAEVAAALTQAGPQIQQMAEAMGQAMEYISQAVESMLTALRTPATGGSPAGPGLSPDAYRGGQHTTVEALYDPVVWPDEGYPCQLCWAVTRWPWEPMRACPITVDPETTYCPRHLAYQDNATPRVMTRNAMVMTPTPDHTTTRP